MIDFYDIGGKDESQNEPMQLVDLGDKMPMMTIGTSRKSDWSGQVFASKTVYRPTNAEDYDHQFVNRIYRTNPPYAVDRFLDHHYNHYSKRFPGDEKTFFKHLKYVIIPLLKKGQHDVYVELVNEWLEEKKNVSTKSGPSAIPSTLNEKLDKILEFVVANPIRNNITSQTIHEEIFEKNIPFQEAQELYRKLLVSGKVRVLGHVYIGHSNETYIFLQQGGFSKSKNANTKRQTITQTPNVTMANNSNPHEQAEVFISYSWDNKEHEEQVAAFTNHLRKNGFNASIDKMISQQETATNFVTMMHKAMLQHPKVIVVLSKGYKKKAEEFVGGVGEEYQLLLNDIKQKPKKYILVSFEGRSSEIIPFGLQGRDIIDLSSEDGEEKLFRKLTGEDEYVFAEVAPMRPTFGTKPIGEFRPVVSEKLISIEEPLIKAGSTASFSGKYKWVEFTLTPRFKNISGKTVEGFAYNILIKRELVPEHYESPSENGYIKFNETVQQKIYPDNTHSGKAISVKIASHVIHQIVDSIISITIYTDSGPHSKTYDVRELFKLRPLGNLYGEAGPLNKDLFI